MAREEIFRNISAKEDKKTRANFNNSITAIDDIKLRVSTLYNYKNSEKNKAEDLDIQDIYNNGCSIVKWTKQENGISGTNIINKVSLIEPQYNKQLLNRTPLIDNAHISMTNNQEPIVKLSYPFFWAKDEGNGKINSCGINYIPPRNAKMLTAITDVGEIYGLSYVTDVEVTKTFPVLQPGEVSISGYGNNFIHFGHSDKITIYCKSNKGEYDKDDCKYWKKDHFNCKTNNADTQLIIIINANDKVIEITARDITNKKYTNFNIKTDSVDIKVTDDNNKSCTKYIQDTDSITTIVHGEKEVTTEIIEEDKITIRTKNYIVNAENVQLGHKININKNDLSFNSDKMILNSNDMNLNSNNVNLNSLNNIKIYGRDGVNIDTLGKVSIKGWHN